MRPLTWTVVILMLVSVVTQAEAKQRVPKVHRSGVSPFTNGDCPETHPIKGNFTTHSGERCIYHKSGERFCANTKAERCYATEAEAVLDGCRRSNL
ncbi:conserved exported protein of unknown function [Nitrospira defluvii]|jgi:hypothetical protein|uniref:Uncharacterized protein n=1 Tax=Nitrospira defluvii TaxID=330214 RepID=D8P7M8_9BACT|nr:conserved exported protein of unknown function [Nitrospira defluvii]